MFPIALVTVVATLLRVFLITRDSVLFAYDMGRDLLWAKDIVFYQTPTLIGPAASIWGVYFGPLWFYFLAIPLFISGGHPLSAVYATAAVIVATGILAFFLFKKYLGPVNALVLSVLILFNSTLVNISTFAFHANVLPLLTLLMIYFCFLAVVKNPIYLSSAFLSVSLMFHADPAPAVVFTFVPVSIALIFKLHKSKNFKNVIFYSLVAYFVPFAPQILFEMRNNFIQTKSLMAYFLGQNPSLSGQLPFFERIINRLDVFFEFFKQSFTSQGRMLAVLVLLAIAIGIWTFFKRVNLKDLVILAKINIYSLIITFLIFTFLVTVEVKDWYLYGTPVIYAFLATIATLALGKNKFAKTALLILFIFVNVSPFLASDRVASSKVDPAALANQLKALNLIYDDAQGGNLPAGRQAFSVYTFTPSVYDYNYQYLFWWQGQKVGRGLPAEFSYLPNQPDYVRNKNFYAETPRQQNLIYLIIENAPENEFYTKYNWLKNFDNFQLVWEKDINSAITVQKRQK